MTKCLKCGYENGNGAVYCKRCGFVLKNVKTDSILLVEPVATSNFFLVRTFKSYGFYVKSLKSVHFVFDELTNREYSVLIMDLDLSERSNIGFLKKLKKLYPDQNIIIITQSIAKEHSEALNSVSFLTILIKPVGVDTILNYIKNVGSEDEFKYPVYNKDTLNNAFLEYAKDKEKVYVIGFYIKDFSLKKIKLHTTVSMFDKIVHSIRKTDRLFVVEDMGILLIIPADDSNENDIEPIKDRIERLMEKNMSASGNIFQYTKGNMSFSDTCFLMFEKGAVKGTLGITEKNIDAGSDIDDISLDELLNDKHLVFSALWNMSDEDVALLYLDKKMKRIVAPFVSVSQAKIIKNADKSIDTSKVRDIFFDVMFGIYKINKGYEKKDTDEVLNSNISLMTLPEIQSNIIMLINEEASFKRIVEELQKDAAISSKVLKLVNSAFFGFSRQIKSLERAAAVLGTEEILGLSLSIAYINSFNKNVSFIKNLWRENIAIMSVIKFIEREYKIYASSITSSILSSIGKIFFAQYFPNEYMSAVNKALEKGIVYDAVELEYFPKPHTQVGSEIIDLWNLPDKIKVSAMYYLYPSAFSKLNTSLHLIHAARYIAGEMGYCVTVKSMDNMSYYTYTMLLKKHDVDVKKVYDERKEELGNYIEDMMFLLS